MSVQKDGHRGHVVQQLSRGQHPQVVVGVHAAVPVTEHSAVKEGSTYLIGTQSVARHGHVLCLLGTESQLIVQNVKVDVI